MWCPDSQSQGIIYRLEPNGIGGFSRIFEAKLSLLIADFLPGANTDYVLGAYNEFYKYIDPVSSDTFHLVGFEATISGGGHPTWNGYYKGGLFAKRDFNGLYEIEEINGTIGANDPSLVANRCYAASPFPDENAVYFGGFDPNNNTSTNMAWIFKNSDQLNSLEEFTENENNYVIYPNPASNQLFIESKTQVRQAFSIINLRGKEIVTGKLNGKIEALDISSLPPNIYIIQIDMESIKFVKTE
jgi:hypothetical protein